MIQLGQPTVFSYVELGVVVVFSLPWLGRAYLAFLRDLDNYRENRSGR